jgi:hypothetical protein
MVDLERYWAGEVICRVNLASLMNLCALALTAAPLSH